MNKISIVTVTYGDRWHFLSQVIQRLLSSNLIYRIIIVDNASSCHIQNQVDQLHDGRLIVIEHMENQGSAAGYKAGIMYAHQQTDTDFIWLLDDGNLPQENTLSLLITSWETLKANPDKTALFCLRPDRKAHIGIAQGQDPYRYYLVPNNFLGFNIFRIPYNQFHKLTDRFTKNNQYKKSVKLPYVPYGGLFLNRSLIDIIGYPDEHFFLYVDDSEYTYRITQNNGNILLIPDCIIHDIDQSVGITYIKRPFHSHLLDQWSFRTYYHVRNRIYFYKLVAVKNQLLFNLNKFILMSWLKFISIASAKKREYRQLQVAVNDGLNGNLGKAGTNKTS